MNKWSPRLRVDESQAKWHYRPPSAIDSWPCPACNSHHGNMGNMEKIKYATVLPIDHLWSIFIMLGIEVQSSKFAREVEECRDIKNLRQHSQPSLPITNLKIIETQNSGISII